MSPVCTPPPTPVPAFLALRSGDPELVPLSQLSHDLKPTVFRQRGSTEAFAHSFSSVPFPPQKKDSDLPIHTLQHTHLAKRSFAQNVTLPCPPARRSRRCHTHELRGHGGGGGFRRLNTKLVSPPLSLRLDGQCEGEKNTEEDFPRCKQTPRQQAPAACRRGEGDVR